ncbi:hypothetical protein FE257_004528 [Aspergillus nanangensis]|uniref:Uncharacterized protein n=1 Tax=Aspergillus nanangensis TaxID=2582783 RepID=A0AAD4CYN5_ASPNN|nr:hypothetical protein FE257_004528 [Aspergillus nanangensis]
MIYQRIRTNDSDTLIISLYIVFGIYHMMNKGDSYRQHHPALSWHSMAGSIEIILYYLGFRCSLVAVAACLVHSWTGLMLVKHLKNGYPPLTRPTYQAGSIMRPVQILYAYYSQTPTAYHDAIMPINAFVYTRVLIFLMATMGPTLSFHKNANSRFVYADAIFGGAVMAVGHCSKPEAVPIYLVIMHVLGKTGLWTRKQQDVSRAQNIPQSALLRLLSFLGFITRDQELVSISKAGVLEPPAIGHLPADKMGHYWAGFN